MEMHNVPLGGIKVDPLAHGAGAVVFASAIGCDPFRALAHLAFCALAIFRREACDMI